MNPGENVGRREEVRRRVRRGAIGVLSRDGAYLMIRRAAGVAKAGLWCFPGGHVERGETPREAVRRELAEELGLVVEPFERVGSVRVPDSRHVLAVWRVRRIGGEVRPARDEVADVRWLRPADIRRMDQSIASNEQVLRMLEA
ncbi:MAG: NUDIX domain-containing protein [Phycisphaerae bacterium]